MVERKKKVAIATTTKYSLETQAEIVRSSLAKAAAVKAVESGYEIVIVDGGSPASFRQEIKGAGAQVYLHPELGMGEQRRKAIQYVFDQGADIIVWMEPEKEPFISLIGRTAEPIIEGRADMVVPERNSLELYPAFQQASEKSGNAFWKELTGVRLDVFFGPRVWRRKLSSYFLDLNVEKYGDKWAIYIPVLNAIIDGEIVVGVRVDYIHPKKQTEVEKHDPEFQLKRQSQLENFRQAVSARWEEVAI